MDQYENYEPQIEKKIKQNYQHEEDDDNSQSAESVDIQELDSSKPQNSEIQILIEHYKKLITYKNNLCKLDMLITLEKDEVQQQELLKMRQDLEQGIEYEIENIKFVQNSKDEFYFSTERLTEDHIGRICRAYFDQENRWYNSRILNIDIENQEAEVQFIGYKEVLKINAIFIKIILIPDPHNFEPGTYCEAIYSGDGQYYSAVIERVSQEGYHVKFKKYNNREVVQLMYLRESRSNPNDPFSNKKRQILELTEFKIPDNLKIHPDDTDLVKKTKKKKIKALKQAFKQAKIEKINVDKQSKWTDFNDKALKKKKGHFCLKKNTESIFKSPDTIEGRVGVTNSGRGMSGFSQRQKFNLTDNSHLSRLF